MKSIKLISYLLLGFSIQFIGCKADDPSQDENLPSNVITKITIDNQGIKWIATNKGLVSFNGKTWKLYSNNSSLNKTPILDIHLEKTSTIQKLWAGGFEGAFDASISGQNLTINNNFKQSNTGLLNDTVFSVATNDHSETFFGTQKGISILKNQLWTSFDGRWGNKSKDDFLTKHDITAIATAKNGWNYVSTKGGGVSRFQYTDAISGATKFFQPWANGLKSDTVFTVIIVNDTCQWYGTTKGAAYHTSHNTKADWTSYNHNNGLCSDTVYAIAQDLNNTVWFGTHNGLSKFSDGTWKNYTVNDGLAANKINTVAIDIDGSVWLGTDNGISHFKNNNWKTYKIN